MVGGGMVAHASSGLRWTLVRYTCESEVGIVFVSMSYGSIYAAMNIAIDYEAIGKSIND